MRVLKRIYYIIPYFIIVNINILSIFWEEEDICLFEEEWDYIEKKLIETRKP